MGKKKRRKTKEIKPDEYLDAGPFEIYRYGQLLVYRNILTEDGREEFLKQLQDRLPSITEDINQTVEKIRKRVSKYHPISLLLSARRDLMQISNKKVSEVDYEEEDLVSQRMIDYILNVIISTEPKSKFSTLSENEYYETRELVKKLYRQLFQYYMSNNAVIFKEERFENPVFERFYTEAQSYWATVRGEFYLIHQEEFFKELLSPHDDELMTLFGLDSNKLVDEICALRDSLIFGINDAMNTLSEAYYKCQEILSEKYNIEELDDKTIYEKLNEISIEEDLGNLTELFSNLVGVSIFDVEKQTSLPQKYIEGMSWEVGECNYFYDGGKFSGWPLNYQPVFEKPFINIDDKYYCFDVYILTDNLYRQIQRLLKKLDPPYQERWNERQNNISETLPLKLLQQIIPGCKIYRNVFYKIKKQWYECDAIVEYYDHLFILEVKGGAFTYTPPASDFEAYISSIRHLLLKPLKQTKQFYKHFIKLGEIELFDSNNKKTQKQIGLLKKSSYRFITPTSVSIDNFTEIAVKANLITEENHPTWSLSISELQVYRDIFEHPFQFTHYIEQRHKAFKNKKINTEDELDHLGLYLEKNHYVEWADSFESEIATFHGYRKGIDEYFSDLFYKLDRFEKPIQNLPEMYVKIFEAINFLESDFALEATSYLLDYSFETRIEINNNVEYLIKKKDGKNLTLIGDQGLTIFSYHNNDVIDYKSCYEHNIATLLGTYENKRAVFVIESDDLNRITGIEFRLHRKGEVSYLKNKLKYRIEALSDRRYQKATASEKPGRNAKCPCGSGKKYKRCHQLKGM